jgi:uncharacterized protein (DUF427 family)
MSKSPGHQRHPDHKVIEHRVEQRMTVTIDGETLASSQNVIRVDEDHSPVRFYFPRADVKMDKLQSSATTSHCPFKGTARYFNINLGEQPLYDAVWSYEDPFDEHPDLKDRLAFYDDKLPQIRVSVA